MTFKELLESKERNRKKKRWFPDYYLDRNYKEETAFKLAESFYDGTMSQETLEHISLCSNFSIPYWVVRGYTEEEARKIVSDRQKENSKKYHKKYDKTQRKKFNTTCIEYWIDKGYNEEDAKELLKNRQSTFTLDKCVEKYGNELGYDVWQTRQSKWQNSLSSKSKQDIDDINKKKNVFNLDNLIRIHGEELGHKKYEENMLRASKLSKNSRCSKSLRSKKLFDKLVRFLNLNLEYTYFAEELHLTRPCGKRVYFYDFSIKDLKIIVEYHGIMYHPREGQTDWVGAHPDSNYERNLAKDLDKKKLAIDNGYSFYAIYSDDKIDIVHGIFQEIKKEILEKLNEKDKN